MFAFVSTKVKSTLLLIIASTSLLWLVNSSVAGDSTQANNELPYVAIKAGSNLVADGNEASEKQIPVLMFFSMKHCPYCIEVEEDYLKPMLRNSEYGNKVIIRKIRLDGTEEMRDFSGKERDPGEFSEDYNVSMVPTLVLVNSKGKKLAPAIIGIRNSHYYSSELDDAIDASTKKIREIAKR